jgi:hypothetical protein
VAFGDSMRASSTDAICLIEMQRKVVGGGMPLFDGEPVSLFEEWPSMEGCYDVSQVARYPFI